MNRKQIVQLVLRIHRLHEQGLTYAAIDGTLGWDYRSYQMMRTPLARRIVRAYS